MAESWSKHGPRLALWDEAFAQDDEGQSDLQRFLDRVVVEVTRERDQRISRTVHYKDEWGAAFEYDVQPIGVKVWLHPDQVFADGNGTPEMRLESVDLRWDWSTPSDFIADFRQALDSLLADGTFEFKHLREQSLGERVGEVAGSLGCLAVLVLLWFSVCAAV